MGYSRMLWVRLGGLNLRLSLTLFFHTKLMIFTRYYTIPAGRKFLGKELKQPYVFEPGWIIGSRWINNGAVRQRVYYHVRSIYDLERLFVHADASEDHARGNAEVSIETALEIVSDWLAFGMLTDHQRAALTQLLSELYVRYARAQRPSLQEATAQVVAAVGLKDRLGRPNLGASSARISAAGRRYGVRLDEITRIVPHLSRLHVIVAQELHRIHRVFLERDCNQLLDLRRRLATCKEERDLRSFISTLEIVRGDLATIRVAPFWRNARYMEAEVEEVLAILHNRRQSPVARAAQIAPTIGTMIASIGFKRAQHALEQIIKEVSRAARNAEGSESLFVSLARKVEVFAVKVPRLNENGFKRKRLARVVCHLDHAARHLREDHLRQAKASLKAASALL